MKLMIDISDSTYESIMSQDWKNAGWLFSEEMKAIHDGTLIPDNATNGEILCSIFSDMHYTLSEKTSRVVTTIGVASSFDVGWWNSPYKRG